MSNELILFETPHGVTEDVIAHSQGAGPGKSKYIFDQRIPGFAIRIFPSGRKVFVYIYSFNQRRRMITIGDTAMITIAEARDRVCRYYVQILDGVDPGAKKESRVYQITFREFAHEYLEKHAKIHKKTWDFDERFMRLYVVPALGNQMLTSITTKDIVDLLHDVTTKAKHQRYSNHTTANRVREIISAMFRVAELWGHVPPNHRNPAKGIKDFKEISRERFASEVELARIASAIDLEESIYVKGAVWLSLLTGLRKNELLKARWRDIADGVLKIGLTKNGRPHYVPLSTAAKQILSELPRQSGNPFIFCSSVVPNAPINDVKKAWGRICRRADVHGLRWHDLRRTCGSWMAQNGASLHMIGTALNHRDPASTAVYARFKLDDLRDLFEDHGSRIQRFIPENLRQSHPRGRTEPNLHSANP